MLQKFVSTPFSFKLFLLWAVAISFILPYASTSAGITEDEVNHRGIGSRTYSWYFENDSVAGLSPVDSTGKWYDLTPDEQGRMVGTNVYGGFFNLLAEITHRTVLSGMDFYQARHMLAAFFGALLFIFTGLMVHQLTGSWRAALFALILATLTPRLFGDAMTNVKDVPLATFFAFSLLQIIAFIRHLPRISVMRAVLLLISFALSIAVWAGSLLLIFYFFLGIAVYFSLQYLLDDFESKQALKTAGWVLGIAVLGYLAASLFWPWAMNNPVLNPIVALKIHSTAFKSLNNAQLFEGQWIIPSDFRWNYVPKWFYITLPVITIAGLFLFLILTPAFLRKGYWRVACYTLLIVSIVLPVMRVMLSHLNPYDACRQFTFILPSILVVASLAWVELFNRIESISIKITLTVAVMLLLLEPALFILRNHPVQSMYFSPLIGGPKGAFKNFEMDYYGVAVRPAFDWIEKNDTTATEERKARVRLWYGEQTKLSHYANKSKRTKYVLANENSTDWDYTIQMAAEAKYNHDLLYKWPPKGTVYEVKAGGAPLCAVIKNFRTPEAPRTDQPAANNDFSTLLNNSYQAYMRGDYSTCIIESEKVLTRDPQNKIAWNNIGSAYNQLKLYELAAQACMNALRIDSGFALARNNYTAATSGMRSGVSPATRAAGYVNLSLGYYNQGDFIRCIQYNQYALQSHPRMVIAYNNLVACFNSLKMYDEAMKAAQDGLKIDSGAQLLKNNLEVTLKAKQTTKRDETFLQNLGYNYYRLGNFQKCAETASEALRLNPNSFAHYNTLCSAYNRMGQFAKAKQACEAGLKLAPDNAYLKNNLMEAEKGVKK